MDAKKVTAAKPFLAGAIYRAKLTGELTLPTSATPNMNTFPAFKSLGYIAEDGVTNSNSAKSENIKAWGGAIVLSLEKEKEDVFELELIEALNEEVLKTVYTDANVTVAKTGGEITILANDKEQEEAAWVLDMALRAGKKKRIVIPMGKVTEVAEIKYQDSKAVGYKIKITAVRDAAGNTHYEYIV